MGNINRDKIFTGGSNVGTGTSGSIKKATGVAVVSTGTAIVFTVPFASTNYAIASIRCYDAGGNNIDYMITNKLATGFTITPAINGFLDYECTKI